MTRDEILAMPAGRELDALVAENVMGLVPCTNKCHANGNDMLPCHARPNSPDQGGETHSYSTDIAAAFEVVEEVYKQGLRKEYLRGLYAQDIFDLDLIAHHRPDIMCRAALLAKLETK